MATVSDAKKKEPKQKTINPFCAKKSNQSV
jgi:hypothetical protein